MGLEYFSRKTRSISLKLVMEKSLTPEEYAEYDVLSADEAYDQACSLRTLHLEWLDIGVIENLEPFMAMEVLYLQYNRIEHIQGLDCCPKLEFLALQNNRIRVINNLSHLNELAFLDLSHNLIHEFDEGELPKSISILNLSGNECAEKSDYISRLMSYLPDLFHLDGQDMGGISVQPLGSMRGFGNASLETIDADDDHSSYWQREKLQSGVAATVKEEIDAYNSESLADLNSFGKLVDGAIARSAERRHELASIGPLYTPKSTPQSTRKNVVELD